MIPSIYMHKFIINLTTHRGVWVAQSVKHATLGLNSGLDLRVASSSPTLDSMLVIEPTFKKENTGLGQKPRSLLS